MLRQDRGEGHASGLRAPGSTSSRSSRRSATPSSAARSIGTDPTPGERIRGQRLGDGDDLPGPGDREGARSPGLAGWTEAKSQLKDDGLAPGVVTREFSDEVAQGHGDQHRAGPGTEIAPGHGRRARGQQGRPGGGARACPVPRSRTPPPSWRRPGLKVKIASEAGQLAEFDKGLGRRAVAARGQAGRRGRHRHPDDLQGPRMVEVPDVVGDSVDDATAEAGGRRLRGRGGPGHPRHLRRHGQEPVGGRRRHGTQGVEDHDQDPLTEPGRRRLEPAAGHRGPHDTLVR